MCEFKINKFITLSLRDEKTIIIVNNEEFIQCKSLLLNIPADYAQVYSDIESIDDAAEIFEWSESVQGQKKVRIPPEVEFWGHCSNLQAWTEHGYDTRLLHSNLAFPLLKKLSDVGDLDAKRVFKLEILRRYIEGGYATREFLIDRKYIEYLSEDDLRSSLPVEEIMMLEDLEIRFKITISFARFLEGITSGWADDNYYVEDYRLIGLKLRTPILETVSEEILETIGQFKRLKYLNLSNNYIKYLPDSLYKLKNLEVLNLGGNRLEEIPESFNALNKLRELNLRGNKLKTMPYAVENISSLEILYVESNPIKDFPQKFGALSINQRKTAYIKMVKNS